MTPERLAEIRQMLVVGVLPRWATISEGMRDLLDHIAAQDKRIAELEAGRVVVPEPTHAEFLDLAASAHVSGDLIDFMAGATAYGIWLRGKVCAIPSDRVLGEGQVAVDREELNTLREIVGIARPRVRALDSQALLDATRRLDALRAQAGKDGAT